MREIKELSQMILEEVHDAMKYAKRALEKKELRPDLARMFDNLSRQEMEHMTMLHNAAVGLINEAKRNGATVPPGMMEAYELVHGMMIDEADEVKRLQQMYREG